MSQPTLLLTNDDGIYAEGLRHLYEAVKDMAEVYIVAPLREQSSTGLSITSRGPLYFQKFPWDSTAMAWSVQGTPADAVKLALSALLPKKPDIVLSGVNKGNNSGSNVLYSGTVAAVIEGVLHGIPGIAFSTADYHNSDFNIGKQYISAVVEYVRKHLPDDGTIYNVNFPSAAIPFKGFKMTAQGKEYWKENPELRQHPSEGFPYYWLGCQLAEFSEEVDCDVSWLKQGYGTIVPLKIANLTNRENLERNRAEFENFIKKSSETPPQ